MVGQNHHDTQSLVRAYFCCVSNAQKHCPSEVMFLWQVDTDSLANLFASVQTLSHASNIHARERADHLRAAVALEEIYNDRGLGKGVLALASHVLSLIHI